MSETTKNIGFLPVNRGEYDNNATYYKDNIVQYNNGSYICSPVGYDPEHPTSAYVTGVKPYEDNASQLNPGWDVFVDIGFIDETPQEGSRNLVRSGSVYDAYIHQVYFDNQGEAEIPNFHPQSDSVWSHGVQEISAANQKQVRANLGFGDGDIDDVPVAGSRNLIESGGVQNEFALGAVYDVSAKNPTAGPNYDGKWESLSALLSDTNLSTLIPTAYRKGGMSIKFVHTSDNNYVQYRYIGTVTTAATFTNVANWELDVTKKNLSEDFLGLLSKIKDFTIKNYAIGDDGKFGTTAKYRHAVLSVNEGEVYYLIGKEANCRAAFVTTDESSSGADVPIVSGTGIMTMGSVKQYYKFIIPQGCTYLIFNASGSYGTRCYKHYDSLKEGTDEYADDKPTAGSDNPVKSGGVAEEFNTLSENVYSKIGGELNLSLYLERGSISSVNGTDESSDKRIRTNNFIKADTINITATSGNKVYVFGYKDDETFVSSTGWITTSQSVKITNATKYRFVFAFSNDSTITPSQFDSLDISITESFNGYLVEKSEFDSEIHDVDGEIHDIYTKLSTKIEINLLNYGIGADGYWGTNTYIKHSCIPVHSGETYRFQRGSVEVIRYAFATSDSYSSGSQIPLVDGTTVITPELNLYDEVTIVIPDGCNYLIFSNGRNPSQVVLRKVWNLTYLSSARCIDLQLNSNNKITIDVVYIYLLDKVLTFYADGNSSSHIPKEFTFGANYTNYLLVADILSGTIVQRNNNSSVRVGDIILLSYSAAKGFDGGALLPTINKLRNDSINKLINDSMSSIARRNYELLSGGGIWKTNGDIISGSSYRTDYIKIQEGCDIFVNALTASAVTALALYSTNNVQGFISAEQTNSLVYKSAKELSNVNAKYFRCSIDASQVADNSWWICHAPITTLVKDVALISQKVENIASSSNSGIIKNVAESVGNGLSPLEVICDSNGYELPTTKQTLDAQKKIEQLTQIKWTPLNAVPYNNGSYPANVEKTGLPYSSVKEYDKFIGFDVSVYTFMTAINNPYSLIYTENVSATNSASAWGIAYHGTNSACYYGLVCNVFALQCNGVNIPWNTHEHKWLSENVFNMIKIYNQSAQGLQIGDIFWQSGHDMIIYKIKRNSDGNVTHVTIAESMGLAHVRQEITAEEFDSMLSTRIIYRSLERFKNKYIPSPFVAIRDEVITPYEYNDDICCFAGDKATFREGDIIVIDYNLKSIGAWTAMELYKDDTLLDTITIDNTEHYVNLTSRNLTYGSYKARMTDGTNYSDYTEFEVIQTTVSVTTTDSNSKVNFASANGSPIYVRICNLAGETYAMYKLTDTDISNGYCIVDFTRLNSQQYPSKALPSTAYVKVYFEGDFGRVTNQLVTL